MILGIIVVEDVFLAFYLALLQPIIGQQEGAGEIVESIATAFAFLMALFALARWGGRLVRPIVSAGDSELTVILVVGFGVFIAGFAHTAGASDAVGALLAGMVVAGTGLGAKVERLVVPLRDTFAAIFFFWFGLTIAPSDMGAVALPVAIAVVITLTFNILAGIVAARIYGYGREAAASTALMLASRGEFELIRPPGSNGTGTYAKGDRRVARRRRRGVAAQATKQVLNAATTATSPSRAGGSALGASRESMVSVRQPGLEVTDDRAQKARCEQPRPEGAG
jgi:CPA2 family monovalent cation:H+ antiporter-2